MAGAAGTLGRINTKTITFFLIALLFSTTFTKASEYVVAKGFSDNADIENKCDKIIRSLERRYGKPKRWKKFPVVCGYTSPGVAGYCRSDGQNVSEIRLHPSYADFDGRSGDHELTHAFIVYRINGNTNLFWNEGTAQNSEYKDRKSLRATVYNRFKGGEFVPLNSLIRRGGYDGGLLLYHQSFSVVDFLIAQGGSKWFLAFFCEMETTNVDDALKRYYGYKDVGELEKDWKEYVRGGQNRSAVQTVFQKANQ